MYEYYEKTYVIRDTDTDCRGQCRPSAVLAMFQDVAGIHSELTGTGREVLLALCRSVWLLARVWFRLERPIRSGETVTVRTCQRGAEKLYVYRDYDLLVDDQVVGQGISAWVVANVENRAILRPVQVEPLVRAPKPEQPRKTVLKGIRMPKDMEFAYEKTVRYSDLDINGHMNNTRYADAALDALEIEPGKNSFLSEIQISYSKECVLGETIAISRKEQEEGWYVDGSAGDGKRFEALLKFSPEERSSVLTES